MQTNREWSEMGSLVTLDTADIRIHRDLTSQTLAAVNTDNTNTFLMMRMSEDDQVQTTTTMKISLRQV